MRKDTKTSLKNRPTIRVGDAKVALASMPVLVPKETAKKIAVAVKRFYDAEKAG
jgi:hypothetical protein